MNLGHRHHFGIGYGKNRDVMRNFFQYDFCFMIIPTFKPVYFFPKTNTDKTEYFMKRSKSKYI